MRTFWNTNHGLHTLDQWAPNCWVQVTSPNKDDAQYLQDQLHIPDYFLDDIADTEERARYDYDEGWVLIIVRIPYVKEVKSRTPYRTIPLGIILKDDVCITVCNFETDMMTDFVSYQKRRGVGFTDSVDMVFRLFLSTAVWYLKRLKQINARIEAAKLHLDRKVDNVDLIALSRLQDSLTYFEHRDESGTRDDRHLFQYPRIDDGYLCQHHQQQHVHRHEDTYGRVYAVYVAHVGGQLLRYEPHQRDGVVPSGIPHRTDLLDCTHHALLVVCTAQIVDITGRIF